MGVQRYRVGAAGADGICSVDHRLTVAVDVGHAEVVLVVSRLGSTWHDSEGAPGWVGRAGHSRCTGVAEELALAETVEVAEAVIGIAAAAQTAGLMVAGLAVAELVAALLLADRVLAAVWLLAVTASALG